jgi:hypothetical protein
MANFGYHLCQAHVGLGRCAGGGGGQGCLYFDAISIALVMVLDCFVCDERSGLSRVYVKSGTNV